MRGPLAGWLLEASCYRMGSRANKQMLDPLQHPEKKAQLVSFWSQSRSGRSDSEAPRRTTSVWFCVKGSCLCAYLKMSRPMLLQISCLLSCGGTTQHVTPSRWVKRWWSPGADVGITEHISSLKLTTFIWSFFLCGNGTSVSVNIPMSAGRWEQTSMRMVSRLA